VMLGALLGDDRSRGGSCDAGMNDAVPSASHGGGKGGERGGGE